MAGANGFRSRRLIASLLLSGTLLAGGAGCSPKPESEEVAAPVLPQRGPVPIHLSPDPWTLTTDTWNADHRGTYLGNGYLGQSFTPTGGLLVDPAQEHGYVAGHYQAEALVPMPSFTPLQVAVKDRIFGTDPKQVKQYHQELRLRDGVLVTEATWDGGAGDVTLEVETAFLRHAPELALLHLAVDNRGREPVTVAIPEKALPMGAQAPLGPSYTVAGVECRFALQSLDRSDLGAAPGYRAGFLVPAGQKARFALLTEVGKAGSAPPSPLLTALSGASVDEAFQRHAAAWAKLWKADIEIEGDPEAEQVVRACRFYLLSAMRPEVAAGVPPMGTSARAFNGHVFWDMDSWMLPAMLPQHPDLAHAMTEYRQKTLPGARANAKEEKLPGAAYAWESGASGKETLLSEVFRKGRHISGDVALAFKQYYAATGDRQWLRSIAWPVLKETADNWAARAQPDGKGGYVVKQVTTPDENAGLVDHSAWTHHVARVNLEFAAETARALGQPANPKWAQVAKGLTFLRAADGTILSYAGFDEKKKSKQADALLLVHPGEAKLPRKDVERLYDFYTPRVIDNGPAMTEAIHAIVACRLGRTKEALEQFRGSYRPFVRPPFHMFSEKRSRDNLCFLTGAAGVVEAVLYGFAGLQLEPGSQPGRPKLEPHLPAEWKALRIKGLSWRGQLSDVEIRPGQPPVWSKPGS